MPARDVDPNAGAPDNRIHFAPPGKERANVRSATPMGFARAVFQANAERRLVDVISSPGLGGGA